MNDFQRDLKTDPRKKAFSIILQYAIFRMENAFILAAAILLTAFWPHPFPWWPVWGWAVLALISMAAIIFSSLTSSSANAELLLQTDQSQFDARKIKQPDLRREVERALEYQRRIERQVRQKRNTSLLWDQPEDSRSKIGDWVENIYQLALRLDAYRADTLLAMERDSVPKDIDGLVSRRKLETDATFQMELDQVIEGKRKQLGALQALETRMKQAELQLEQSLTALATMDSQIQLIDAQDVNSSRSESLREDIKDQINRLNDLVASINEVYDYKTPGIG